MTKRFVTEDDFAAAFVFLALAWLGTLLFILFFALPQYTWRFETSSLERRVEALEEAQRAEWRNR